MLGRIATWLLAVLALSSSIACTPMTGIPSLSLMSRDEAVDARFVAVAERTKDSDCFYWAALLLIWGIPSPSHEAVIERMLEEHEADAILDARITSSTFGLPYFYLQVCTNVEGTPAKLVPASGSQP